MIKTVRTALDYYRREHVERHVIDKRRIDYLMLAINRHLGRRHVAALGPATVTRYASSRCRGGAGPGTIRRELGCLVAALRFCHRHGKIETVPAVPLPAKPPARERWLTRKEADRLLAAAGDRARLFIQIALATGGRPDAIDQLRWVQVDLDRRLIDFNEPGRRQTRKRRPVVPISDRLFAALQAAHAKAKTPYVLGSPASTRKCFETARQNAGLPDITRKTLRHTFATWAAQAGKSLWDIAGVLGDTYQTVERNYAHHHPEYLRDVVNL